MSQETLSTELSYAVAATNVVNLASPVVEWDVPESTAITIQEGHAAVLDAAKADGSDVSRATRVGFGYREPNDPLNQYRVISDFSVAPFNALSLKDQQSGDNAQRRRVTFDPARVPGGSLTVEDADTLALLAFGPDEIDPATLFFNYPMSVAQR